MITNYLTFLKFWFPTYAINPHYLQLVLIIYNLLILTHFILTSVKYK